MGQEAMGFPVGEGGKLCLALSGEWICDLHPGSKGALTDEFLWMWELSPLKGNAAALWVSCTTWVVQCRSLGLQTKEKGLFLHFSQAPLPL